MSDVAIRVEGLSKQYRIGGPQARYKTLRESLVGAAQAPIRRAGMLLRGEAATDHQETIWALKDVSFEVKHGDVLGIIGRNGAGKSTLLKILSRITAPTEGTVDLYGRVGSLLEVGTGFHPELTGRENIYLNGAILGMKRAEIDRKFDEIVAFAELEKFLDTPVKHYSSGMYVRLAFAVAAHLDPEILLVDEVLAVGDAAFQKKCLGKMGEVAGEGRTVLFVSHNMGAVSRLCKRSLLLRSGKLVGNDHTAEVISRYLQSGARRAGYFSQPVDHTIPLCLLEAKVYSDDETAMDSFPRHEPVTVWIRYKINWSVASVHIYSSILAADGTVVLGTGDADTDQSRLGVRECGTYICQYQVPARTLNEADYRVSISLGIPYQNVFQSNDEVLAFSILDVESADRFIHRRRQGTIWLDIPWNYVGDTPF